MSVPMSVTEDLGSLTDEQLRERVVAWLHENLPAEWIDAAEADDEDAVRATRRLVDYAEFCARLGQAGWATPTWPREYRLPGLEGEPGPRGHQEAERRHPPP